MSSEFEGSEKTNIPGTKTEALAREEAAESERIKSLLDIRRGRLAGRSTLGRTGTTSLKEHLRMGDPFTGESPAVDSKLVVKEQIIGFEPSTLETMDQAMFNWLNDGMATFSTTNKGWKKVPIVWVAGERSWQLKNHKDLRDNNGALIFPIITLERTGYAKDIKKKGAFFGNVFPVPDKQGGAITIARRINQEKTANYANANSQRRWVSPDDPSTSNLVRGPLVNNKKVVYETITMPMPSYVDVSYQISIRTEYQQQMNEILQPFTTYTGGINYFIIQEKGHNYEAFLQSEFASTNDVNALGDETRIYETKIQIKLLGYLVGAGKNDEKPHIAIRENAVEIKIPREHVLVGDSNPWRNGKYRP